MNKRNIIIIVVIVNIVLAASIVTLYFTVFNNNNSSEENWTLTIKGDISQEISFNINETINELEQFPSITQWYVMQESGTSRFNASYTGVSLYYILTEIANATSNVNVRIGAIDQLSRTFDFNLINETRNMIVAYLKNGEVIKSFYDGGTGPLRLIVPQRYDGDYNAQFCVKFVTEIEITLV